jgi:hypothetical protein
MIYDCFTFFNELDLLEIRLNILHESVDKFVLVEATKTHANTNKPLYFAENKDRYQKFLHKIIHIVVDHYPPYENSWTFEKHQRNCIMQGLQNCQANDTILISDLDEIPNPKKILKYQHYKGVSTLKQKMFYYYLNNINLKKPFWADTPTKMCLYEEMRKNNLSPQIIRFKNGRIINNGGWHFSYLGGAEKIVKKIQSFAHQEYNKNEYTNIEAIKEKIENGQDIFNRNQGKNYVTLEINQKLPDYIIKNQQKYLHLIKDTNINSKEKLQLKINSLKQNIFIYIKKIILQIIKRKKKVHE